MKLQIAEPDYLEWKHHPVSKIFLQYLADYREALIKQHVLEWQQGKLDEVRDLELRGRVMALADLTDLSFSAMEFFYATPEEESDAA
jgi:hypothetical protein